MARLFVAAPLLASILALGACAASQPAGPSVLALPGKDKSFPQFQADDANCRNYAQSMIGPRTPAQAGTNAAVGSAAVGTALGAAAGALIGSTVGQVGAGAAIGAGSGLLVGSAVGASNAQASSGDLQQRYDISYMQCMTGNGENIQAAALPAPAYAYAAPYPYAYPYYAPAPVVVGPPVIAFGGGYYGGGYYGGYRRRYWGGW
jgi:outer membrane lipoprotein SlyB